MNGGLTSPKDFGVNSKFNLKERQHILFLPQNFILQNICKIEPIHNELFVTPSLTGGKTCH